MKFIDLFAGLGGFHTGFSESGFKCVYASELDIELRDLYKKNFGIEVDGDITKINEKDIPVHDVLCAGFPCQPFSLAGKKKGEQCPSSGKLIDHVLRIIKYHSPKFVVLENVPNILTIENGEFWKSIKGSFKSMGYFLDYKIMSPLDFGIPQNRKRVFIVGCKDKALLDKYQWPSGLLESQNTLSDLLEPKLKHKKLEPKKIQQLIKWQALLDQCDFKSLSSNSIVAPEFGATYPLNFQSLSLKDMKQYKGAYGKCLLDCKTWEDILNKLPSYARKNKKTPEWLLKSVINSRDIYSKHTNYLDEWINDFNKDYNSWQILEWRGFNDKLDLSKHLLQFRASGIRVSKPFKAPSLVAMTPTQIPVIGSEMRYISTSEAAKLQSLHNLKKLPDNTTKAFKALGNAVNAKIVQLIAQNLQNLSSISSTPH